MSGRSSMLNSDFYCTKCGQKGLNVWRHKGSAREDGHLKCLYCFHCQDTTNHVECKPNSTTYSKQQFLEEYYGNNFTPEGLRKQSYKAFRSSLSDKEWENLQNLISELDNYN